jgi:pimeloyl-ACP methyl ester carboxylesterase
VLVTEALDGRTVTFRRESGKGPTLVCLHGATTNHRLLDRLIDALPGHDRIALNLPGRAGTDGPALSAVAPMAGFLRSFLERFVDGPYVLVGYSLGGAVAMEHALSRPDDLAGLVLVATGARLRVNPLLVRVVEAAKESGGELPPMPAGAFEDATNAALVEEDAELRSLTPIDTAACDWRACDAFDRMSAIDAIDAPTLIVGGTEDLLAPPKFSDFLGRSISGSELQMLQGARHMMVMERAEEIASLVRSFVSRL